MLRQTAHYLLLTEVTSLRNPQEALALAERSRSVPNDPFQLHELLATAYAENHRYREAAENERKVTLLASTRWCQSSSSSSRLRIGSGTGIPVGHAVKSSVGLQVRLDNWDLFVLFTKRNT